MQGNEAEARPQPPPAQQPLPTLASPGGDLFGHFERIEVAAEADAAEWAHLLRVSDTLGEIADGMRALVCTTDTAWTPDQVPHTRIRLMALLERIGKTQTTLRDTSARLRQGQSELRSNTTELLCLAIDGYLAWRPPAHVLLPPRAAPPIDLTNPALGEVANEVQDTTPLGDRLQMSLF